MRCTVRCYANTNAFNFDAFLAPRLNPLPSGERGFRRNVTIISAFAMVSFLYGIAALQAIERCDHSERPNCIFEIKIPAKKCLRRKDMAEWG